MNAHTPGDWAATTSIAGAHTVIAGDDLIADCGIEADGPALANARLISAAPDLLAAVETAMRVLSDLQGVTQQGSRVRAAWQQCRDAVKAVIGEKP